MSTVNLNLRDESDNPNNNSIVIFQKENQSKLDQQNIAWHVIKDSVPGQNHKIPFSTDIHVTALNSWGNEITYPMLAHNGDSFRVVRGTSGEELECDVTNHMTKSNEQQVEICNTLDGPSIDALIYRDGKLLAVRQSVSPDQKATFKFSPTIWIGVSSQVHEGEIISSDVISSIDTKIGLEEIKSVDIIMTGGGDEPFKFELENIVSIYS